MRSYLLLSLLVAIFLASTSAFLFRPTSKYYMKEMPVETSFPYKEEQHWFNGQLIDHFNPQDARTYSQRYWTVSEFYDPASGPIFLFICGEYTCPGVPKDRLFPLEIAKEHKALFVVLEHRFYGKSQPFDDLSTEALSFLNVEQALEDLAYFMQWFKVNSPKKITDHNKWITVGGSYPGAMAAWFRYKYPHLTVGSWASSAVVNAILDFPDFDKQIYTSARKSGPECPAAVQKLTEYFESQLYDTPVEQQKKFHARFGNYATKLSKDELLWYISDMFVDPIQYGRREELCQFLTSEKDFNKLVDKVIEKFNKEGDPRMYGSYYLRDSTYRYWDLGNARQWNYQVCTQFGWLQTPATEKQYAMRSQRITLDFYKQLCSETFGKNLWPDVNIVNHNLGGLNITVSNLLMTNGAEDPWQWATKLDDDKQIVNKYIDCDGCAHCVELYTPKDNESKALKDTRAAIKALINKWLGK